MAKAVSGARGEDVVPTAMQVGTEVTGEVVELGDVGGPKNQLPALAPNAAFYIAIHPNKWFVADGLLVPNYKMAHLMNGVQCAQQDGATTNMSIPKDFLAARGYTVVPTRNGPGGRSYLKAVDVKGGKHFCTVWETARAGESATEFDNKAFHDWAWNEVKAGRLPPPATAGLRRLRQDVAQQHAKAASRAKVSAEGEADAALTAAALKVIDAALAKLRAAAPVASAEATELD